MKIDYTIVTFENVDLFPRQAEKLRGYFVNKYSNFEVLSNHKGNKLIYSYPKIQYKVIKRMPVLCGIMDGARIAAGIGAITEDINISGIQNKIFQKEIKNRLEDYGTHNDYISYKFITPWIALNQRNIKHYRQSSEIEKDEILNKILIGNILSMSKGLNYSVNSKLHVWLNVNKCIVKFKNVDMIGFKGYFKINFRIPDYLGIGKSVSKGFGTIKCIS